MSHRRFASNAATVALAATALLPTFAVAQDAAQPAGVKGDMLMWIKDAHNKIVQLAEATPEGKYAWRPGKGVRSTGEVFMHVAAANYGIPSFAGVADPAGFEFATFEKTATKKDDIVKHHKESLAHMENALAATTDADMEKPVKLFGMDMSTRGAYMLLLSHAHEHLGQSIAYARSNNITPPWTAKMEAAAKEKKGS